MRGASRECDAGDLDPRQILAVAVAALVAALGLELHHPELRTALLREDPRLDLDLGQIRAVDDGRAVDVQQRLELDAGPVVVGQALDQQRSGPARRGTACRLFSRLRRSWSSPRMTCLGPTRPLRRNGAVRLCGRGAEALILGHRRSHPRPRPSDAPSTDAGCASTSDARAAVRPTSSIRTRCFSPTYGRAAGHRDDVAVDLGDRVAGAVHVRLDDLDVNLLALAERQRPLEHLLAIRLEQHREVLERQALRALEVEPLAGLCLDRPAARARRCR